VETQLRWAGIGKMPALSRAPVLVSSRKIFSCLENPMLGPAIMIAPRRGDKRTCGVPTRMIRSGLELVVHLHLAPAAV
jgi:hypothetical protein